MGVIGKVTTYIKKKIATFGRPPTYKYRPITTSILKDVGHVSVRDMPSGSRRMSRTQIKAIWRAQQVAARKASAKKAAEEKARKEAERKAAEEKARAEKARAEAARKAIVERAEVAKREITKRKIEPRPTAIGLPTDIPFIKRPVFSKIYDKAKEKFDELIPEHKRGIIGLFGLDKDQIEERQKDYVIIQNRSEPSGQATITYTTREKNFFEKLNINPNDKSAQDLKRNVERTQMLYATEGITEAQAKSQNEKDFHEYTSTQMMAGLPTNVALGAGFGIIAAIPGVGQIATTLLGADLLIKRKAIVNQFKEFPLESTASFSAFGVGGIAGSRFMGKITSTDALTKSKDTFVVESIKKGGKKTPLSETFPREIKFKINENAIINYAKTSLKKQGIDFTKLGKIEQNFITGQIKAHIRNNPQKFIPKIRQQSLKNLKEQTVRDLLMKRLEGKFDKPINFKQLTPKQKAELVRILRRQMKLEPTRFIPKIRRLALEKAKKVTAKERMRETILEGIKPKKLKDLLTTKQKSELVRRLKRKLELDPEAFLPKIRQIALKRAKKVTAKERMRETILEGLKPKKLKDLLTNKQKAEIIRKFKRKLELDPEAFLPKIQKLALKRAKKVTAKERMRETILEGMKSKKLKDLLTNKQKAEILRRLERKAKLEPEAFIPKTRKLALERAKERVIVSGRQQLILKQKQIQIQKPQVKVFKIVPRELTQIQKLALNRLKKAGGSKLRIVQQQKFKQVKKVDQGFRQAQKQVQRVNQKFRTKQAQLTRQRLALKSRLAFIQRQPQISKQLQKQSQKLNQALKQNQKQSSALTSQSQSFSQAVVQVLAQAQIKRPPKPKLRGEVIRTKIKPMVRVRIKPKIKLKKPVIKQGFNVYGKHKKKFIKLSKVPLSKAQARDRGAFAIDKSTGVTFKLKGVGKVKKLGKLTKGEKGHFSKTRKKYRTYRIQKGKRITLKDRFIEKRGKPRIDTRGEKKDLSLARFAKQRGFIGRKLPRLKKTPMMMSKPQMPLKLKKLSRTVIKKASKGEKPTRWRFKGNQRLGFRNNKVVEIVKFNPKKPTISSNPIKRKRTSSPAQLEALAKGRAKRMEKLRRR